jgi:hypothetical protein
MAKTKHKQKYYNIPVEYNPYIPEEMVLSMVTRNILNVPEEQIPVEVIEAVIDRPEHYKYEPIFIN